MRDGEMAKRTDSLLVSSFVEPNMTTPDPTKRMPNYCLKVGRSSKKWFQRQRRAQASTCPRVRSPAEFRYDTMIAIDKGRILTAPFTEITSRKDQQDSRAVDALIITV